MLTVTVTILKKIATREEAIEYIEEIKDEVQHHTDIQIASNVTDDLKDPS